MLQIFERRILIIICSRINDVIWITRFSNELYMLCNELDIVKVIM